MFNSALACLELIAHSTYLPIARIGSPPAMGRAQWMVRRAAAAAAPRRPAVVGAFRAASSSSSSATPAAGRIQQQSASSSSRRSRSPLLVAAAAATTTTATALCAAHAILSQPLGPVAHMSSGSTRPRVPATADLCDEHEARLQVADPKVAFRAFGQHGSFGGEIRTIKCFENNPLYVCAHAR